MALRQGPTHLSFPQAMAETSVPVTDHTPARQLPSWPRQSVPAEAGDVPRLPPARVAPRPLPDPAVPGVGPAAVAPTGRAVARA